MILSRYRLRLSAAVPSASRLDYFTRNPASLTSLVSLAVSALIVAASSVGELDFDSGIEEAMLDLCLVDDFRDLITQDLDDCRRRCGWCKNTERGDRFVAW